jgi:hypothetical protein
MEFNELIKNNGALPLNAVVEQYGITQNRGQVIPGRFYSFKVVPDVPSITESYVYQKTGKYYLDLNPTGLLLFHDNWKEVALFLNIKIMPPAAQLKVMEAYWNFSKLNGLSNLFDKDGKLKELSERQLIDQRFYLITPTALSTILGVNNLNYAINNYNMDKVAEAKLIDWDNFGMLVNPKISTHGLYPDPINLGRVYEEFLTNTLV